MYLYSVVLNPEQRRRHTGNSIESRTWSVIQKDVLVRNRLGIHARPAALIVRKAAGFQCDIRLRFGEDEVNAKSIMGVMTLAAGKGAELTIVADGKDEEEAVNAIYDLVSTGFGEE